MLAQVPPRPLPSVSGPFPSPERGKEEDVVLVQRASSESELGRGGWLLSPAASPKALGQLLLMHWIVGAEKQWEEPLPAFGYACGQ